jgi:hypothetical protein
VEDKQVVIAGHVVKPTENGRQHAVCSGDGTCRGAENMLGNSWRAARRHEAVTRETHKEQKGNIRPVLQDWRVAWIIYCPSCKSSNQNIKFTMKKKEFDWEEAKIS